MPRSDAFTRRVLTLGFWSESPLFLIDVGASGGIDRRWNVFAGRMRGIGFDPLVPEVDRLNATETRAGLRYEAALVGCRHFDDLFPPVLRNDRIAARSNDPFTRVSASAAQERLRTSYIQEVFNAGAAVVVTERLITLDEYIAAADRPSVDFVKIDTDGHDIEVLLGAEELMAAGGALGVMIEAQFHGSPHEYANTFANVDRLLRRHGFSLFDISINRYSRSALPAPFVYDLAAQTVSGQVLWGDAVYFRDLGDPAYEQMWRCSVTPERVLKLACLFEQFDLPDCAAELLLNRGAFLDASRRDELLDLLIPAEASSYREHKSAFDADFASFYPSRRRKPTAPQVSSAADAPGSAGTDNHKERLERLAARTAALKAKNARLSERLEARDQKIARLVARVRALEARARDTP